MAEDNEAVKDKQTVNAKGESVAKRIEGVAIGGSFVEGIRLMLS